MLRVAGSTLDTGNGDTLAAAEGAGRVLKGKARPGFQTPADLFGHDIVETVADTRPADL
jgi:short subunit dehydrogenase-like uncharacterized protein